MFIQGSIIIKNSKIDEYIHFTSEKNRNLKGFFKIISQHPFYENKSEVLLAAYVQIALWLSPVDQLKLFQLVWKRRVGFIL